MTPRKVDCVKLYGILGIKIIVSMLEILVSINDRKYFLLQQFLRRTFTIKNVFRISLVLLNIKNKKICNEEIISL